MIRINKHIFNDFPHTDIELYFNDISNKIIKQIRFFPHKEGILLLPRPIDFYTHIMNGIHLSEYHYLSIFKGSTQFETIFNLMFPQKLILKNMDTLINKLQHSNYTPLHFIFDEYTPQYITNVFNKKSVYSVFADYYLKKSEKVLGLDNYGKAWLESNIGGDTSKIYVSDITLNRNLMKQIIKDSKKYENYFFGIPIDINGG